MKIRHIATCVALAAWPCASAATCNIAWAMRVGAVL
jgi:hypothetical protein